MTRTKRLLAAAAFAALPLGAASPRKCRPRPAARTPTPGRGRRSARSGPRNRSNSAAMSARYALGSGDVIGGASGLAQRLLGAAQTVQVARQPVGCR